MIFSKQVDIFWLILPFGKIGPKFSHLLTVRAEGADPPPLTFRVLCDFFKISWHILTYFTILHLHFAHLLTVRAKGADSPSPPCGQPDRKKAVFLRLPLGHAQLIRWRMFPYSEFATNETKLGDQCHLTHGIAPRDVVETWCHCTNTPIWIWSLNDESNCVTQISAARI